MMLGLRQPVNGGCRKPAFPGSLQVIEACANGGEPVGNLMAAGLPALGVVLHEFSMPGEGGRVTAVKAVEGPGRGRGCRRW